ncbi:MAG: ArsC family (seleno)protein [Planctomycetota bacterium]
MARHGLTAREVVDARKVPMGKPQIAALLRGSHRVIAVRGTRRTDYDLRHAAPTEKELYEAMLGPTGNLRAPTLRLGKTLLVGFNEEAWKQLLC